MSWHLFCLCCLGEAQVLQEARRRFVAGCLWPLGSESAVGGAGRGVVVRAGEVKDADRTHVYPPLVILLYKPLNFQILHFLISVVLPLFSI
jgi:hypothetical protein